MRIEVLPEEQNAPLAHVSTYWGADLLDPRAATLLTVEAGEAVTGINASLAPSAYIGGNLTTANVDPNVGVSLYALAEVYRDGEWLQVGIGSQYDDVYLLSGLPTGSYRLRFFGTPGSRDDYGVTPEYWPNALDEKDAQTFSVGPGARVIRNAALVRTGDISGRLTTAGLPNGIHATVKQSATLTLPDGTFSLRLDPGRYRLGRAKEVVLKPGPT